MAQTRLILRLMFVMILMARDASSSLSGLTIELTHVDSHGNFTKFELLQRATLRSNYRIARLTASGGAAMKDAVSTSSVEAPVHAGNGEFLMELAIGTPSLAFSAILDTGSDLIWTQCLPCVDCFSQPTTVFNPSASLTYAKLPCSNALCQALPTFKCGISDCEYLYTYGDSSSSQGVLSSETFTFGSNQTAPGVAFGCGDANQGGGFSQGSGLVGLGRGLPSLISQLALGKFSYCLTSLDESKKSPLLLGSAANLSVSVNAASASAVKSTPLLKNPVQPSFYYLNLQGISVGATRLPIPASTFSLQDDGTGGLIIDSGTSITYLAVTGYMQVKKAFLEQVQLPAVDGSEVGLDVCFTAGSAATVEVPKLTLHFKGADLDLPAENYMILDPSTGLMCLTILESRGLSILGNFQQQNLHILYDLNDDTLSFVPVQCDQLQIN